MIVWCVVSAGEFSALSELLFKVNPAFIRSANVQFYIIALTFQKYFSYTQTAKSWVFRIPLSLLRLDLCECKLSSLRNFWKYLKFWYVSQWGQCIYYYLMSCYYYLRNRIKKNYHKKVNWLAERDCDRWITKQTKYWIFRPSEIRNEKGKAQ